MNNYFTKRLNNIFDWIMLKVFSKYVLYIYKRKLSFKKVSKVGQFIWNSSFAEDFTNYVERNT